jgi:hypothetical protein
MPRKDTVLCGTIRSRVDKWEKYWNINRSLYYDWIDFVMGDQWREDESKLFERYNKIPLMMNKLGMLMNHMVGDQIQNTPNLQISPEEDVSPEDAQTRAALIKNISLNSHAGTVYQTAYGQAIVGGYSAFRLGTEYINENSFDQEITVHDFNDPNMCYFDIGAEHKCKVDGMYAGFKTRISREAFRYKWGQEVESQIGTEAISEDTTYAFSDDDSITQIDDYERVRDEDFHTIYQLSDGSIVNNKEFAEFPKEKIDGKKYIMKDGMPLSVLQKREVMRYKVVHRQIAGDFVLEETDFPSERLPIIFVDQKSYYTKNGLQITRSFFKDVKDAQKYLNYLATQSAYIMKISRYDQFIMPRKCAAAPDTQQQWRDPSVVRGALYYDETPSGARPEQLRPPELSQSLTMQYERTLMDIQSGTGIFNTQLGEMGNEISGTAIEKRNMRGAKNTQIPRNSLEVAITTAGEIINEMIPKVYDTERMLILPMANSMEERVMINKPMDEYGLAMQNNMTKGRYKIRLKPGLSFEGQKQEALESLQSVLAADRSGSVFPMIADLYAENLPIDNNIEIRNRLRTIVPPDIIEAGKTGKPLPPKPPQPNQDMMMLELKKAELDHKIKEAEVDAQMKMRELDLRQAEIQRKAIETQQDMSVAWERLDAERQEAAAQLQAQLLRYKAEGDRIGADLEINNSHNLVRLLTHNTKH